VRYKKFDGTFGGSTVRISRGQTTIIGYVPYMFEAGN
jgi:hypothetical protein